MKTKQWYELPDPFITEEEVAALRADVARLRDENAALRHLYRRTIFSLHNLINALKDEMDANVAFTALAATEPPDDAATGK